MPRDELADFRGALALLEREPGNVPQPRRGEVHPPEAPIARVDAACEALLKVLNKRCPHLKPAEPVAAGGTIDPLPVTADEAANVIRTAMRQAVVRPGSGDAPDAVLWREGPDALLVEIGSSKIEFGEGEIAVHLRVQCDQLPNGADAVAVRFVVGTAERPAGLMAATTAPEGPQVVIRRWGDALTALAWRGLLDAVAGVAAAAGRDEDGTPLIPAALVASRAGMAVLAQARHPIDRLRPGAVGA
jgi:hypothetical protein